MDGGPDFAMFEVQPVITCKVAPTNGVYFGPYLRYTNMDLARGAWLGSILLVTDAPQPPTIHIHQSVDLSPNPRQLKAANIATHHRWTFYKYEVDLPMDTDLIHIQALSLHQIIAAVLHIASEKEIRTDVSRVGQKHISLVLDAMKSCRA